MEDINKPQEYAKGICPLICHRSMPQEYATGICDSDMPLEHTWKTMTKLSSTTNAHGSKSYTIVLFVLSYEEYATMVEKLGCKKGVSF